jgi:glyoxylase-like metal-dependent hydrolase (beta-lactamase superfamily II)
MAVFTEVGDRVWVARYEWWDVNVSVVEGEQGLVVVDTNASSRAAGEVVADLRRLSPAPVVGIVNTHAHFDHTFGNHALRQELGDVPITAHEDAAAGTVPRGRELQAEARTWSDPRAPEIVETTLLAADRTFSSVLAIDLGDRAVELVHPGRGHTAGDLVVRIEDADVLLAGDLVEESGMPSFGADCHPMEWPLTLDLVHSLAGAGTVIVPGHGAPVDLDFAQEQRSAIGIVAETIRDLAGRGVPQAQALGSAEWPYPREHLADAVRRGYEQLPRSQKRLPLV